MSPRKPIPARGKSTGERRSPSLQALQQQASPILRTSTSPGSGSSVSPPQKGRNGEETTQKGDRMKYVRRNINRRKTQYGDSNSPPTTPCPQSQPETAYTSSSPASGSGSSKYSKLVMKVYMGGRLHSIFDHATKKYVYHAKQDREKNYHITYRQGLCTAIHNSSNVPVYVSRKCQES